jgi:hypothetical protein
MRPQDPQPGSWLHSSLQRDMIAQGRRQRAAWARWDARLDEADRKIASLLEREREAGLAAAQAELAADDEASSELADHPVIPELVEGRVPDPPSADDDLLAASPWSPQYAAWRSEHVPTQSNGVI